MIFCTSKSSAMFSVVSTWVMKVLLEGRVTITRVEKALAQARVYANLLAFAVLPPLDPPSIHSKTPVPLAQMLNFGTSTVTEINYLLFNTALEDTMYNRLFIIF